MTRPGSDDALVAALTTWLPEARWFPLKSHQLQSLEVVDRLRLPLEGWREFVVVDALADGPTSDAGPQTYALPIAWQPDGPRDAAADPLIAGWLGHAAINGDRVQGSTSALAGVATGPRLERPWRTGAVTPLAADSSNTLLILADSVPHADADVVLKLLRQVRPGIQPEVEIGSLLAAHATWHHSPRLRGYLEWQHPSRGVSVVGVVHDRVPHAVSLWSHLLEILTTQAENAEDRDRLHRELKPTLTALGHVTANMHRVLADETQAPAFGTDAWVPHEAQAAAAAMVSHATKIFDALDASRSHLPVSATPLLDQVLQRRAACITRLAALGTFPLQSQRIRVHGDYHLGQVLTRHDTADRPREDQLFVIDFEGEPQRSLADRRHKYSAAKDVAGMIRSLDYLVQFATREGARSLPPDAHEQFVGWFLSSYVAAAVGTRFWPSDPAEAQRLLDVYCLDKAIYEVAYEANNRPDWMEVPLRALLERTS